MLQSANLATIHQGTLQEPAVGLFQIFWGMLLCVSQRQTCRDGFRRVLEFNEDEETRVCDREATNQKWIKLHVYPLWPFLVPTGIVPSDHDGTSAEQVCIIVYY